MMLLIAALSGCKSTPNIGQDQEFGGIILDVPIHGGEPVDKPRRVEIVESIDTIQLQGSVLDSFIDRITDVRLTDDLIFVSSSDVINVFDRDGRHLRKIQRKGRGPGEYLELSAFDIDPEHRLLYILDRQSNLIIIYDFEGKFERRIQLDSWGVTEFAVLPGGHLLILDLMNNRADHRGLYEADENGLPLRQLYAVAPEYDHIIYGSKFLTHISDSEIGCLGLEDNDLIYHFRNDSLAPVYKVKTDIVMPDYVPENELCAACKLLHQCVGDRAKTQSAIERIHYMHEMEPLLEKKVTVNGNGHDMSVSFSRRGNKHLLSDTYGRCNNISKDDLKNLDKILASSTFVTKTQLSKDRKDDIRRFYYYRAEVNGRTVYLNVAETDYRRPSGKWFHDRFVFSVTDSLKKE